MLLLLLLPVAPLCLGCIRRPWQEVLRHSGRPGVTVCLLRLPRFAI